MRKTIAILLLLCSLCTLLSACIGYKKGITFDNDFLRSVSLENMPLPVCENYALYNGTEGEETLKFETNLSGFELYINAFISYMQARSDIYYFGVQESDGLLGEMLPHRLACEITEEFEWESSVNWYTFSYSLTDALEEHTSCSEHKAYKDPVIVKFEYDKEEKVAKINISKNDAFASDCIDDVLLTPYVFELDHYGEFYRISGVRGNLSGEITLPESYKGLPVTEVDMWGFSANGYTGSTDGVTKVIIPDCYREIGFNAFDKMPNLKTVIIGNGVKEIASGAFEGCKNLETVVFGSAVEAIYAEAFQDCEKLDNVVLPASLKEITYRAFAGCKSLRSIVIPKGVTEMLADAFYENDSLTDIYCEIEAAPDGWSSEWCGNYKEYCVNNDVTVTFGYGGEAPTVYYCVSFESGYDYEPVFLEKACYLYAAGSEVVFYLKPIEGEEIFTMYIGGVRHSIGVSEEVPVEGGDGAKTLWKYTFTMPAGHANITFKTETASA